MLTDEEAIAIALDHVRANEPVAEGIELAVDPEHIKRVPGAVIVGYTSAEFLATRDPANALVGSLPIRVDEETRECSAITLAEYLELYT